MAKRRARPRRTAVSREEFHTLAAALERCRRDLDIQFKRTAQVQAEVEALQRAVRKLGGSGQD
jgi:hypothetical protein